MALRKKKANPPDGQMELIEHLGELRTRIFRCLIYIVVGMILTYNLFHQIYTLMAYPLEPILAKFGTIAFRGIQSAFLIRMQVAMISGIAVAFPFVTLELWGFIEPALTPEERKPVAYLAPFSILLFLAGIATGYACLPTTFGWMASYIVDVPDAHLIQDAQEYIVLTVKIILAFGIAFQLPMVLLFLARIGLITAELMTQYWRHAVVGISVAAAILTPSNDPMTMLMMAIPMAGLYLLSIGLVRAFEPKEDGKGVRQGPSLMTMILVAMAPVVILVAAGYWLYRTGPAAHGAPTHAAGVGLPNTGITTSPPGPPAVTEAEFQAMKAQVEAQGRQIQALEALKNRAHGK